MNMEPNAEIKRLVSESVGLLKGMTAIPSPSFHEDEVCGFISRWMTDKGLTHQRHGNNIIAANIDITNGPVLMLCAHIDTVSPCEGYGFDPYMPDYEEAAEVISRSEGRKFGTDDIVAGLGTNDDGASVVSMIAAYRYFYNSNKANIVLVLTCEEERSGPGGMTGLWGDVLCRRDEGIDGAVPVDYAIIGEPTGMKAATSERGLLVIDAVAHGVSGHAARNEGRNALYIALDDISRIRGHAFGRVSPRMGKVNMNVTQINAGTAHNVIPDTCSFVIDIRPTEQYDNEDILNELQGICESMLKARNLTNRSSATAEESPLQQIIEDMGIESFSSPTTSDWMRVGCDAIKMGPGESSRSHRKDEFVFISEIDNAVKTYIEFINRLI